MSKLCPLALAGPLVLALSSLSAAQCASDDPFAGNHDCASAVAITPGDYLGLRAESSGGNTDFFTFTVPGQEQWAVFMFLDDPTEGEMWVWKNDCQTLVTQSQIYGGTRLLTVANGSTDPVTVYLECLAAPGVACLEYDVRLLVSGQGCPANNHDNDTCATAMFLPAGDHFGFTIDRFSSDHYWTIVEPGHRFYCWDSTNFNYELGLVVRDDCGAVLAENLHPPASFPQVSWTNTGATPVRVTLEVSLPPIFDNDPDCRSYILRVQNWFEDFDDAYEFNNTCGTASPNVIGPQSGLTVELSDQDYYEYDVQPGRRLETSVSYDPTVAEVNLRLVDWNCQELSYAPAAGTGTQSLSWTNTTGLTRSVRAQVTLNGGQMTSGTFYSMDAELMDLPPVGSSFCSPAVVHSEGFSAELACVGSSEIADNDLVLMATQLPSLEWGYFLCSTATGSVQPPGSSGVLCLGGAIGRMNDQVLFSRATGSIVRSADLTMLPTPGGSASVQSGETWCFQAWFRDGNSSNFTDGVSVTFQ